MAEYDSDSAGSNAEEAKVRGQYGDLTLKLKGWYKEDIKKVSEWRKQAREDYEFYSGEQWSQEDMNVLRDQRRPAMVFNRVAPLVNAVVGSEINNRREVQYIPREVGDAQANEVLTSAGEWFRDQTGAEDEESDAFEDAVICGMGWTDTRLDFEEDPDGAPKVTRLDPLRMAWDCTAVKPNLEDAQRLWYVDEKPYSEIKEMFPGVALNCCTQDGPRYSAMIRQSRTTRTRPTSTPARRTNMPMAAIRRRCARSSNAAGLRRCRISAVLHSTRWACRPASRANTTSSRSS